MTLKDFCEAQYAECMFYYKEFGDPSFKEFADQWFSFAETASSDEMVSVHPDSLEYGSEASVF